MPQGEMHWYLVGGGYHYCDHWLDYTTSRQGEHVQDTACGKKLVTERFPVRCFYATPVRQDFVDGKVCKECASLMGVKDEWPQWVRKW